MAYPEKAARSVDELRRANAAINQRLEAQEDNYRDQGMDDAEIQDRLAADKWNFQKEWLDDRYPGEHVSPHVFNSFSPNGAKDLIAEANRSPRLKEAMKQFAVEENQANENENSEDMEESM